MSTEAERRAEKAERDHNRTDPDRHREQVRSANRARDRARRLLIARHRDEYDLLYRTEAEIEGVQPQGRLEYPRGYLIESLSTEDLLARRRAQHTVSNKRPSRKLRTRRTETLNRLESAVDALLSAHPEMSKRYSNRLARALNDFLVADAAYYDGALPTPDDQVDRLLAQVQSQQAG